MIAARSASCSDLGAEVLMDRLRHKINVSSGGIRTAFCNMDKDRDGLLSSTDVMLGLQDLGVGLTSSQARTFIDKFDRDGDGQLTYKEFMRAIRNVGYSDMDSGPEAFPAPKGVPVDGARADDGHEPTPAEIHPLARTGKVTAALVRTLQDRVYASSSSIRKVFREFDDKHDGVITHREFERGIRRMNLGLPADMVSQLVRYVDKDGNGKMDFNEFVHCLKTTDTIGGHNAFLEERTVSYKEKKLDIPPESVPLTPVSMSSTSPAKWGGSGREDLRRSWERRVGMKRNQLLSSRSSPVPNAFPSP